MGACSVMGAVALSHPGLRTSVAVASYHVPTYALGDRCPTLVLARR